MSSENSRDRNRADLRDRYEAAERLRTGGPGRRSGCLPLLGLGLVVAVAAAIAPKTSVDPSGADLTPLETQCDGSWARKVRAAADRRGVVRGQASDGLDIIIVVNPFTWHTLGLQSQRLLGLAEACRIQTLAAVNVKFHYNRDGADILRMPRTEIYELAKKRFVAAPAPAPPAGMRDIAWGGKPTSDLKAVPGSDSVLVGPHKPPAPYLGVAASDEDYIFERGRLVAGDIYFAGAASYAAIKAALVKAYGPPSTADLSDTVEIYAWEWPKAKARIQLSYNTPKTSATLHLENRR